MPSRFASVCSLLLAACSGSTANVEPPADMAPDLAYVSTDPLIVARPYQWFAPETIDANKAYPLVVVLHGFRATGFLIDRMLRLSDAVEAGQFVYALPEGSKNVDGYSHWNSGGDPKDTDDVAYLDALIADMGRRFHVDSHAIFVIGHSNGAAMAYRYGCLRADRIAAIVPMAGTYTQDPKQCALARPLSQLQIYGDGDPGYPGMPSVREQSVFWAMINGCGAQSDTSAPKIHLGVAGKNLDTTVEKWSGCQQGVGVDYWVVGGAPHNIQLDDDGAPQIVGWLKAHAH